MFDGSEVAYNANGVPRLSAVTGGTYGIASDSKGNIYNVDYYYCTIQVIVKATGTWNGYSVAGDYMYHFAGNGACGSDLSSNDATTASSLNIFAIGIDKNDDVYFSTVNGGCYIFKVAGGYHGTLSKYFGSGECGCQLNGGSVLSFSYGIAFDPSNQVIFSQLYCRTIMRIDHTTRLAHRIVGNGMAAGAIWNSGSILATDIGMDGPAGIATDGAGNIYYTDQDTGAVRVVDANTGLVYLASGRIANGFTCVGECSNFVGNNFFNTWAVALDSEGTIYFTPYLNEVDNNMKIGVIRGITPFPTAAPTTSPSNPTYVPTCSPFFSVSPTRAPAPTKAPVGKPTHYPTPSPKPNISPTHYPTPCNHCAPTPTPSYCVCDCSAGPPPTHYPTPSPKPVIPPTNYPTPVPPTPTSR
jgi:hypothetical protein